MTVRGVYSVHYFSPFLALLQNNTFVAFGTLKRDFGPFWRLFWRGPTLNLSGVFKLLWRFRRRGFLKSESLVQWNPEKVKQWIHFSNFDHLRTLLLIHNYLPFSFFLFSAPFLPSTVSFATSLTFKFNVLVEILQMSILAGSKPDFWLFFLAGGHTHP